MLQKLQRAKSVARGCGRNVADVAYRRKASELEQWLMAQVNGVRSAAQDVYGQIVKWFPERRFGFIAGPQGKKYFFHFSAVISPHEPEDVREGARVLFNPEKDIKGERAANVGLTDLMQ